MDNIEITGSRYRLRMSGLEQSEDRLYCAKLSLMIVDLDGVSLEAGAMYEPHI